MCNEYEVRGMRQKWMRIGVLLVVLLVTSAVPGHAWRGGHGFRHGGHVFFRPSFVFPIGPFWAPYWGPYWDPYGYGYSSVVTPPPQVYVQPAPQTSVQPPPAQPPTQSFWYYCENPQGYYPYVQQCPGGWQPVAPIPQ